MSSVQDQLTNDKGNWLIRVYSKCYYERPGVVGFEQMLKLSINLSFFPMGNTFS